MARVKYDYKEGELGPRRWIDHHLKPVGVSTYVVQGNGSGVGSSPTLTTQSTYYATHKNSVPE